MSARPPLPLPPPTANSSSYSNADKNFQSSSGDYVNLSECASGSSRAPPLPPRRKSSRPPPVFRSPHYDRHPNSHTNLPPKPLISRWSLNSIESRRSPATPTEVSSLPQVLPTGLGAGKDSVNRSPPKYFFPPHQDLPRTFGPSRGSLPALFPSLNSRREVDCCSSTRVITQPFSFKNSHPQTGNPILPCPLTPKLTPL